MIYAQKILSPSTFRRTCLALLAPVGALLVGACGELEPPLDAPVHVGTGTSALPLLGEDNALVVSAANTVLNEYAAVAIDAAAGGTSIEVTSAADLDSATFGTLGAGDLLLIMQMQGALIDTTDDEASYGAVTDLGSAGLYEMVSVSEVNGNVIGITSACGGLVNSYSANGKTQVVRVPQLTALTVNGAGSIVPDAWDGSKGGVVALHVRGQVVINGTIDASGRGFRGGAIDTSSFNGDITTLRSPLPLNGAEKGEGVAGFAADYDVLFDGRYGRGAPANGGGGGNAQQAGGGGGANGNAGGVYSGHGVMGSENSWTLDPAAGANSPGGGRGGYTFSNRNRDAETVGPNNADWEGNFRRERGGRGGHPLSPSAESRVFLGGGGGAGDGDADADAGQGGRGGGIVLLIASDVSGAGRVLANGAAGGSTVTPHTAGAGGGGGGGSVVIKANSTAGIQVQAMGGSGGNQLINNTDLIDCDPLTIGVVACAAQGPGGGGGGGFVAVASGPTVTVAGGVSGTTTSEALTEFPANGASNGAAGDATTTVGPLSLCSGGDVSVTVTHAESPDPAPGETITYTITVTNNELSKMVGVRIQDTFPAALTSHSWTCTPTGAGTTCGAASGSGDIDMTVDIDASGTVTFVVTASIDPAATGTLANTATVTRSSGTTDPDAANNSATDSYTLAPLADLSLTVLESSDPVDEKSAYSYTLSVANAGPSVATSLTLTQALPSDITFATVTDGAWACAVASGTLTCTLSSLLAGATADDVVVNVSATPFQGGLVSSAAAVSASAVDADVTNNEVTAETTITGVNDAPVNTAPASAAIAKNSSLTFAAASGNPLSVSDIDAAAAAMLVTVTVTDGTFTLGDSSGLDNVSGDGSAAVTLEGNLDAVNAALEGSSYTPTADFGGAASLTLVSDDQGNTGSGGALSDTEVVSINVLTTNAAPFAVDDNPAALLEDSGANTLDVLANDSDPDGDAFRSSPSPTATTASPPSSRPAARSATRRTRTSSARRSSATRSRTRWACAAPPPCLSPSTT